MLVLSEDITSIFCSSVNSSILSRAAATCFSWQTSSNASVMLSCKDLITWVIIPYKRSLSASVNDRKARLTSSREQAMRRQPVTTLNDHWRLLYLPSPAGSIGGGFRRGGGWRRRPFLF
uniref:Uncharacterized protein n=1 Tax=Arundo donax TaxID=35708 RepID=A0A0A9GBX6_ARUDO